MLEGGFVTLIFIFEILFPIIEYFVICAIILYTTATVHDIASTLDRIEKKLNKSEEDAQKQIEYYIQKIKELDEKAKDKIKPD